MDSTPTAKETTTFEFLQEVLAIKLSKLIELPTDFQSIGFAADADGKAVVIIDGQTHHLWQPPSLLPAVLAPLTIYELSAEESAAFETATIFELLPDALTENPS